MRQTALTDIGRLPPGSIRQPSANPENQARRALADRSRRTVSVSQSSS